MTLDELIAKLKLVMNKWQDGTRHGNDGNQGNTLEDLLGVTPEFGENSTIRNFVE